MARDSRALRTSNAELKKISSICWLCGEPIDRTLTWPDPMSWSADHVTPVGKGGDMLGDRLPAHLVCNQRRGTKDVAAISPRSRGTREW